MRKQQIDLESKWKDLTPDERQGIRNTQLKPILEDYLAWLQDAQPKVVKKSKLGQATNYSCLLHFALDADNTNNF